MTKMLKRWRRAVAGWLRSVAGRVDPGWPLPAQYTAEHILRYHDLMIDVGLADTYDRMATGDGAPAGAPAGGPHDGAHAGGPGGPAPPPDARHEPGGHKAQKQAAEAMQGAQEGITAEEAQRIRRAFAGEIDRLNLIILDIDERQAEDVPIDVTIQALQHFVPVYAAATTALIGTPGATMQA